MRSISLREAISTLVLIVVPMIIIAQIHNREKDFAPFHFGITMGYNSAYFKIIHHADFIFNDSISIAESTRGPGLNIGIVSNLRLSNHFDLRFIPALAFSEKNLHYTFFSPQDSTVKQTIESIYLDFPVVLKFKSERVKNFRMYIIGGGKYSIDMASTAEARNAEGLVKIENGDISAEVGVGMEFYAPLFKFSPELKFSYGIFNIHSRDEGLIFSRVIDQLKSRTFLISFHFEG